ncbi:hypothetical protein [Rhizobium etli]|nr:hypothetical protein [Rhizobium etli]
MLDLFERRLRVYDEVHKVVVYFWTNEGNLVGFNAGRKLAAAYADARFLFGDEVPEAIESLKAKVYDLSRLKNRLEKTEEDGPEREAIVSEILGIEDHFNKWPLDFSELCLPYLKMDQKRIRTPAEWLSDRNKIRLSYADKE